MKKIVASDGLDTSEYSEGVMANLRASIMPSFLSSSLLLVCVFTSNILMAVILADGFLIPLGRCGGLPQYVNTKTCSWSIPATINSRERRQAARASGDRKTQASVQHSSTTSNGSATAEGRGDTLPAHFVAEPVVAWVQQMLNSYRDEFGEELMGENSGGMSAHEQVQRVAMAPFAVVSHDFLRDADDPIFIYGTMSS